MCITKKNRWSPPKNLEPETDVSSLLSPSSLEVCVWAFIGFNKIFFGDNSQFARCYLLLSKVDIRRYENKSPGTRPRTFDTSSLVFSNLQFLQFQLHDCLILYLPISVNIPSVLENLKKYIRVEPLYTLLSLLQRFFGDTYDPFWLVISQLLLFFFLKATNKRTLKFMRFSFKISSYFTQDSLLN